MPPTTPDTLTSQYQQQQAKAGAAAALAVYGAWQYLDLLDLPGSTPAWVDAVVAALADPRRQAAEYAVSYLTKLRALETSGMSVGGFHPVAANELDVDRLRASLNIMGPTAIQRAIVRSQAAATAGTTVRKPVVATAGTLRPSAGKAGATPVRAAPVARANPAVAPTILRIIQADTAKVAIRHVRDGGRETIEDAVTKDKAVIGYYRQTAAKPCYFCLLLASRGPVYGKDSFKGSDQRFSGPGNEKVHDNCNCFLVPLYDRKDEDFKATSRRADALYRSIGNEHSGRSAVRAFRREYEAQIKRGEW